MKTTVWKTLIKYGLQIILIGSFILVVTLNWDSSSLDKFLRNFWQIHWCYLIIFAVLLTIPYFLVGFKLKTLLNIPTSGNTTYFYHVVASSSLVSFIVPGLGELLKIRLLQKKFDISPVDGAIISTMEKLLVFVAGGIAFFLSSRTFLPK